MPAATLGHANGTALPRKPRAPKAKSINGAPSHIPSPYEIMAGRIANRVAEMAENITFVERARPGEIQAPASAPSQRRPPRKLEIRLQNELNADSVHFSPAFLDNTLAKMLELQNRMLKVGKELAHEDVSEEIKQEQFKQSAELSRIVALICAEKARQGA